MHGDALLLILVMVFGCAAFFFGVIYLVFRVFAWFGRGFVGVFRTAPPKEPVGGPHRRRALLVCPREECQRVEGRRDARYCSQCGVSLRPIACMDQNDIERIESPEAGD